MGFRYRKSINLGGGFRVNLSKSGVGYSWGTKGMRVTKTATGKTRSTLSIPGTGISYVTESGQNSKVSSNATNNAESKYIPKGIDLSSEKETLNYDNLDSGIYNDAIKETIRGRTISFFLNLINIILFIIAFFYPILFILVAIMFITSSIVYRKLGTLHVEYDLDEDAQSQYNHLCNIWHEAFESNEVSQISRTYITNNKKENCGAKGALKPVKIKKRYLYHYPELKTNIDVFQVPIVNDSGGHIGQVILLPDRVLISKSTTLAAIDICNIKTSISIQPLAIEPNSIPEDAYVAEYKYLHTNNDGSPDKRYKNNPSLPVIHYGRIDVEANNSTILSLLFSNLSTIQKYEKELPIENIKGLSEKILSSDEPSLIAEETQVDSSNQKNDIQVEPKEVISDLKSEVKNVKNDLSEEWKKTKNEISAEISSAKSDYFKKIYTPKQVKLIFLVAIAIAAFISLILVLVMHSQGDDLSTDIFMFILCTIVFSIITLLGALIICIPSIKNNRKNK